MSLRRPSVSSRHAAVNREPTKRIGAPAVSAVIYRKLTAADRFSESQKFLFDQKLRK